MGKAIRQISKHSQSQLSTQSIKEPILSSSYSQASSSTALTRPSVSSVIYKEKTNSVFCSQNTIQNDLNITNNDDIKSCETPGKNYRIPTTSTHNHHALHIGATSLILINLNTPTNLPLVGK